MGQPVMRPPSPPEPSAPLFLLLLVWIAASGFPACGSTTLTPGEWEDGDLTGSSGTLLLGDSTRVDAVMFRMTPDSIIFGSYWEEQQRVTPRQNVISFAVPDGLTNFLVRPLAGAAIGAGVGALAMSGSGSDGFIDEGAIGAAGGGLAGLAIGLISGIISPSYDVYNFRLPAAEPHTQADSVVTIEITGVKDLSSLVKSELEYQVNWGGRVVTVPRRSVTVKAHGDAIHMIMARKTYETYFQVR